MRKSLLFSSTVATAFVILAACSGTSSVTIPGPTDGADGATKPVSDAAPTDASPIHDGAVTSDATDPPKDAGIVVKELPAPDCHDLKQVGSLVTPTFSNSDPPVPAPLATITPGLYVVKEILQYGPQVGDNRPTRITAYFNGTREYYISDNGTSVNSTTYSIDYKIANSVLSRTIACPPDSASVADDQIGASTNGFTIFFQGMGGTTVETVRYEHAN